MIDTNLLAHFEFPSEIVVLLADSRGDAVRLSDVKVQAKRGFVMKEVWTDAEGAARISKDHSKRSQMEWASWSIMDHPGDYSLVRFVTLWVEGPRSFGPEQLDLENAGPKPTVWLSEKS